MKILLLAIALALTVQQCVAQTYIVTSVAGDGYGAGGPVGGYSGDGGPAVAARLSQPASAVIDASGNLYLTDRLNRRIRRVDPSGIINTIAGTGSATFGGDGGPASLAQIADGIDIDRDAVGNIYILDKPRVRKINTAGIINTIAGNGLLGHGGDGGPATAAPLQPNGIHVDTWGNIYIAQVNRVRKVDPAGIITTIAGTGVAGYSGDGGPATSAQVGIVNDIVTDTSGNLYLLDVGNQRVRKINTSGIISTFAGTGATGYSGDGGPATAAPEEQAT